MHKRFWPCSVVLAAALPAALLVASVPARGQDDGPTDAEQATMDEVRQTFQKIMGNMIAKGINPRDFFQQMQNGTDPADIAKHLVDQGVIDQASLTRVQTDVQKLTTGRVKAALDATDAEWMVLEPMVRKVMTAQAALQRAGGGGGMGRGGMGGGMMGGFMAVSTPAGNDLSRAARALRTALDSRTASGEQIAADLADLRQARRRAAADVADAQKELIDAVTERQEGVLYSIGILE